jgi:LysM repeat protein
MTRVLAKSAVLVLIPALLIAGCTKQKPGAREATTTPGATAVASGETVTIPTAQVGGELLPTLTPTPEMTTISTQPTVTPTRDFGELTGAQTTPTAVTTVTSVPLSTPVPVLTPLPVATQLPAATPLPAVPTPSTGQYAPGGLTYVVRWGDTLSSISYQFGVTVQAIKSANGLSSDVIVVGQQLIIPGVAGGPSPGPGGGTTVHIVQPGENLFRVALRYNTTVEAIAQASGIANPWFIYVGQQLTIPVGGGGGIAPPTSTHVVQPGETLYLIAARFNTTVQALMVANNLSNPNLIYVGQVLKIP